MLKRLFIITLLVLLGFGVFQSTVLPGWVEHVVKTSFESAGFEVEEIHIQFFSIRLAEFKGIILSKPGHIRIESLKAHYSLSTLLNKHIDKIDVAGVEINLDLEAKRYAELKADIHYTEKIIRSHDLPFDSVQIDLSRLLITRDKARLHIPFSGDAHKEDGKLVYHIMSDVLGGTIECHGTIHPDTEQLKVQAQLSALNPGLFPQELVPSLFRIPVSGNIQGQVHVSSLAQSKTVNADISMRIAGTIHNIPFAINQARVTAAVSHSVHDADIKAAASIEQLQLPGYDIHNVSLTVSNQIDGIHLQMKGSGQHLSFDHCDLYITGHPNFISMLANYDQMIGTMLRGRVRASRVHASLFGCSAAIDLLEASSYLKLTPSTVRLNDINIKVVNGNLAQGPMQCRGINGEWRISEFKPISTPNGQLVTIDSARWNQFAFQNGRVLFGIENPNSVFVERSDWDFCDGRVSCRPFRFDPNDDTINANAFFEELDLDQALTLIMPDIIHAEGHLYGRVPLHFRWRKPLKLSFRSGFLYSIPSSGKLSVTDPKSLSNVYLSESEPTQSPEKLEQQIYASLSDFEYSLFKIDFESTRTSGTDGTIHIRGKGAQSNGVPLGLSMDFNIQH